MARSRSCYSALRGMVDAFTTLNLVAIIIYAGYLIVSGSGNNNTFMILLGIAIGLFGCFLSIASRQASLLLVDIADILIEQNRTKAPISYGNVLTD